MDNLNNLECSLLGILGSIANGVVGGVAAGTELKFLFKIAPNQTCFVLTAAYLFRFSVHLNSTLQTVTLRLFLWILEGSERILNLLDWSHLDGFFKTGSGWNGGVIKTSGLLVPCITNNNHKLRSPPGWSWKITNHKFPSHCKESSLQITNA